MPPPVLDRPRTLPTLVVAAALALAAAVSLGLARFSYALLLAPMRADLGWSYLTAGAMNTVNACGYLLGALVTPMALRRFGARAVLLAGSAATGLLLAAHGEVVTDLALYLLRLATGIASAATFISGGLLAARLGRSPARREGRPGAAAGLVLGIYYGGAGIGIVVSALLVPPLAGGATLHAWQTAWIALGAAALLATLVTAAASAGLDAERTVIEAAAPFRRRDFGFGLVAYGLFGLGYIGYMTFVVTLLHEQHLSAGLITAFYALLGLAVIVSPWLWAGLLQRFRGGLPLCVLSALLALATLLPVLGTHPLVVIGSGLLFGAVFLSLVASTTALVCHNLPSAAWPAGIGAFTTVFAAGQIVGPSLVGWVADRAGGLQPGLACSAAVLAVAAVVASRQKPLPLLH
jgi:predicted MFS family arabinose efflux permease